MLYNRFGNTTMNVSRIGLGTFLLGRSETDPALMPRILDEALDRGINLIDTADSYVEAETRVGHALAANKKRDQLFLSSKLYKVHPPGKVARNSRENILRGIEESLRKLQTDYVDIYLLHHPDKESAAEETLRALDDILKSGKARHIGASNHYAWQIAHSFDICHRLQLQPFSIVQNCYNVVWRTIETEYLHFVRKFNLGFMAYSPLGVGLLTGNYAQWANLPTAGQAGEFRAGLETRGKETFDTLMRGLMQIAKDLNLTLAQLAILWLLSKPVVSVALVGATEPGQLTQITNVTDAGLNPEIARQIDHLTAPAIHLPYRNQPEVTGGR